MVDGAVESCAYICTEKRTSGGENRWQGRAEGEMRDGVGVDNKRADLLYECFNRQGRHSIAESQQYSCVECLRGCGRIGSNTGV